MTGFIQPLDLQTLLVSIFAGNMTIFIILSYVIIAFLAARFRMTGIIMLVMISLFTVFMAQYTREMYFMVILLTGLGFYYILGRLLKY